MARLLKEFHGVDVSNEIVNLLDKQQRKLVKSFEISFNKETNVIKYTLIFKNGNNVVSDKTIKSALMDLCFSLGIDKNDITYNDFFNYNYLVLTRMLKEHGTT